MSSGAINKDRWRQQWRLGARCGAASLPGAPVLSAGLAVPGLSASLATWPAGPSPAQPSHVGAASVSSESVWHMLVILLRWKMQLYNPLHPVPQLLQDEPCGGRRAGSLSTGRPGAQHFQGVGQRLGPKQSETMFQVQSLELGEGPRAPCMAEVPRPRSYTARPPPSPAAQRRLPTHRLGQEQQPSPHRRAEGPGSLHLDGRVAASQRAPLRALGQPRVRPPTRQHTLEVRAAARSHVCSWTTAFKSPEGIHGDGGQPDLPSDLSHDQGHRLGEENAAWAGVLRAGHQGGHGPGREAPARQPSGPG
ncbi:thymidylate kinase isoform X1 [Oryx dammah]|uniref:thymidylate kinase isoform X1 n=1 Tax=Oryx dammah TaxID=59534 RepID=UPI001A9A9C35|nr:thymidylate kinase isoform X1 [Oryx dammah]